VSVRLRPRAPQEHLASAANVRVTAGNRKSMFVLMGAARC
jgi:hypothetical protein